MNSLLSKNRSRTNGEYNYARQSVDNPNTDTEIGRDNSVATKTSGKYNRT
jgi:hypothetical protein